MSVCSDCTEVFPVVYKVLVSRIFTVISGVSAVVTSISTVASIVPTAPVVALEVFSVSTVVFGTSIVSRIYRYFNTRDQEPFQELGVFPLQEPRPKFSSRVVFWPPKG